MSFPRWLRFATYIGVFVAVSGGAIYLLAPRVFHERIPVVASDARCPVCGMYPARFPKWKAQIVFKDGDTAAFESLLDLLRYSQDLARYSNGRHTVSDISKRYVTDYVDGNWLEAHQAFFVIGSATTGPMGEPAVLPFASHQAADAYAKDRGGKVLEFGQITPEVMADLGVATHLHRY